MGKRKVVAFSLGVYIDNKYQYSRIEKLCKCSDNLETLFVEITNTEVPQITGVVYRPPSGNIQDAHAELDVLMKFLPSNNAALTGDFNFDLLAQGRDIAEFEQTIYKSTVKI